MAIVTSTKSFIPSLQGEVQQTGSNASFSTLRSGAGNGVFTDSVTADLLASNVSNTYQQIIRGIILFNTTSIPVNATITAASIVLPPLSIGTALGTTTLEIVASNPASNTVLASTDYATVSFTSFSSVAFTSLSSSTTNTFTLNASGISNITIGGISKFAVILGWDLNNSFTGTWASDVDTYASYTIASSPSSVLSITYTQPALAITGLSSLSNVPTITTA